MPGYGSRKPLDHAALEVRGYSLVRGRRYRVVLILNPHIEETVGKTRKRIMIAFGRELTRILAGYQEVWVRNDPVLRARVDILRQTRGGRRRTPAGIAEALKVKTHVVERIVYRKSAPITRQLSGKDSA